MIRNKSAIEKIILAVDERHDYGQSITKQANMAYAQAYKIITILIEAGILIKNDTKDGRILRIKLTPKGERIKKIYQELNEAFSSSKQNANNRGEE